MNVHGPGSREAGGSRQERHRLHKQMANVHVASPDDLSDADYSALVQSLIDDEDDVEAVFSMLKCSMIEAGTYYE